MDRDSHIEMLKRLIEQNKASLAELQRTLADLEGRRHASAERHSISPVNQVAPVPDQASTETSANGAAR